MVTIYVKNTYNVVKSTVLQKTKNTQAELSQNHNEVQKRYLSKCTLYFLSLTGE